MPCFVRLEDAAIALMTTAGALEDLERCGWIPIVEKDGWRYLRGHHQSRAQFVLNLKRQIPLGPGQSALFGLGSGRRTHQRKRSSIL